MRVPKRQVSMMRYAPIAQATQRRQVRARRDGSGVRGRQAAA